MRPHLLRPQEDSERLARRLARHPVEVPDGTPLLLTGRPAPAAFVVKSGLLTTDGPGRPRPAGPGGGEDSDEHDAANPPPPWGADGAGWGGWGWDRWGTGGGDDEPARCLGFSELLGGRRCLRTVRARVLLSGCGVLCREERGGMRRCEDVV
jgi:hypothetical protein